MVFLYTTIIIIVSTEKMTDGSFIQIMADVYTNLVSFLNIILCATSLMFEYVTATLKTGYDKIRLYFSSEEPDMRDNSCTECNFYPVRSMGPMDSYMIEENHYDWCKHKND